MSTVLVVSFDPVMYMVHEEDGQVTLTVSAQGSATITLSVNITTSPDDGTANGQLRAVRNDHVITCYILSCDHPMIT